MAGAVFVDLTAACVTVWHCGLTFKLLRLLRGRHMVRMIMELVDTHTFTLTIGSHKRSRLRRHKMVSQSHRDPSWHQGCNGSGVPRVSRARG